MPRVRLLLFSALLGMLFLVPTVQAQYGYYFGRNKIQYENFDWNVMRTEHFDVYFYPEMQELAEHGAFFAEEAYDELQNKFNFSLNHRVPIIFYSSNLHFKQTNITPGFIPDGVGGFFEFLKGRVVIPANGDLHRFRRVVRHELVHVYTYNKVLRVMRDHRKAPDRFLPLWFTEGLAEYWSGTPDYDHEMVLRDALFSNYFVPLESMFRINGSFQMYKQGEAICRFISETYGEEKLLDLIDNFWKDRDFRKVIELTVHEHFSDVSQRLDAWVKEQYYPMLDEADFPTLIADRIAAEGFNSKPALYQFEDGRRKVYFVGNHTGYSNVYQVEVDSLYRPVGGIDVLIRGERGDRFEAFHLFESRISISHDGQLAFVTKSGERDVIHVYDLEADRLGATYGFDNLIAVYSPAWSPDGKRLVFSSIDRTGFSDLYTYNVGTGTLNRLTNDTYDDRDPAWSPDGQVIAFSSDRTARGHDGYYNLFTYDLDDATVRYVTYGDRTDFSPRWSPDGLRLIFVSAHKDSTGRYSARNIWAADMSHKIGEPPAVASAGTGRVDDRPVTSRSIRQLTNLATASYDPLWTADDRIVFTSFEGFRFTIRSLAGADSLFDNPRQATQVDLSAADPPWAFARLQMGVDAERAPYRRKYKLDLAQGAVSQNAVLGTTGGAVMAFSDMLGDDYLYVTVFNTSDTRGDFLRDLSFQVARVQLHRRANTAYGLYRFSGPRYDITDPDASARFPRFRETIYGGFGAVSYPLSKFRRIEFSSSLNWSDKQVLDLQRKALLLSNSISLVHDNALYSINGPVDGWRGNLTAAYTTDIKYSNVSYVSAIADVRHYFRIGRQVTFASWAMARINQGREARLHVLGGSWDLRGFRFLSVRGQKLWFTSHELRFPIMNYPSLYIPILAPFGIANLRGALFFDAAHAWNEDYDLVQEELNTGETIGAAGIGLRMNLFGGFVLRYDFGYRYRDGFNERDKRFRQFFFGWDF